MSTPPRLLALALVTLMTSATAATRDELLLQADTDLALEISKTHAVKNRADQRKLQVGAEYAGQYYEFALSALKNEQKIREDLFEQQSIYHPLIFGTVVLIVLTGLALSVFQMYAASKIPVTITPPNVAAGGGAAGGPPANPPPDATEIEIGLSSLKIRTQLVGLAVLGLSLAFFYLYLMHVYRIVEENRLTNPTTAAVTSVVPK